MTRSPHPTRRQATSRFQIYFQEGNKCSPSVVASSYFAIEPPDGDLHHATRRGWGWGEHRAGGQRFATFLTVVMCYMTSRDKFSEKNIYFIY